MENKIISSNYVGLLQELSKKYYEILPKEYLTPDYRRKLTISFLNNYDAQCFFKKFIPILKNNFKSSEHWDYYQDIFCFHYSVEGRYCKRYKIRLFILLFGSHFDNPHFSFSSKKVKNLDNYFEELNSLLYGYLFFEKSGEYILVTRTWMNIPTTSYWHISIDT